MMYRDVYDEYVLLLQEKSNLQVSLSQLKKGYISTKTISNKKYAYLQYRQNGKLISEFIKKENLSKIKTEIDERAEITKRISEIEIRLDRIEAAANILDNKFYQTLINLRRCKIMDSMSNDERDKSLKFGNAMTALEGIVASEETEECLSKWVNGNYSFQESFLNTLQTYNLA